MSIRIAISTGDFNGIGPEIILKTLSAADLTGVTPIILGARDVFEFYAGRMDISLQAHFATTADAVNEQQVNVLDCFGDREYELNPGQFSLESGKCAMVAVEKGIELCMESKAEALVTAPISKEAVNKAGYDIPGHTEFLAEKSGASDFMMMLVSDSLRVGLATIHIPLSEVSSRITEEVLHHYFQIMASSLESDFGINNPQIAVLGLNPHAGDGGVIGSEEIDIISPAIQNYRRKGTQISGPYPADSFFGNRLYQEVDGVLAMYHDQGLIPFKALSFGSGVNFTAGLPFVRTSPDHGTAFDIAGTNRADPSSFKEAFDLAVHLAQNREKKTVK